MARLILLALMRSELAGVGDSEVVFLADLMEGSSLPLLVLGFRAWASFVRLRKGVSEAFVGALEMLRDC